MTSRTAGRGRTASPTCSTTTTCRAPAVVCPPRRTSPRVPVPAWVGHTYYTYQPFLPNELLYQHHRTYYRYYDQGRGLTRTAISWSRPPIYHPVPLPDRPLAFRISDSTREFHP